MWNILVDCQQVTVSNVLKDSLGIFTVDKEEIKIISNYDFERLLQALASLTAGSFHVTV